MKKEKLFPIIMMGLFVLGASYTIAFKNGAPQKVTHKEADTVVIDQTDNQNGSELLDAEGKPVNFADFKGKVVFVNNWASWCPPCVAEMPTIENLKESFAGQALVFVMVSFDQEPEKGLEWMQRRDIDLPVYFPGRNFPQEFMTNAIPATFILDQQGKLIHRQLGMADYSHASFQQQMQKWIDQ